MKIEITVIADEHDQTGSVIEKMTLDVCSGIDERSVTSVCAYLMLLKVDEYNISTVWNDLSDGENLDSYYKEFSTEEFDIITISVVSI